MFGQLISGFFHRFFGGFILCALKPLFFSHFNEGRLLIIYFWLVIAKSMSQFEKLLFFKLFKGTTNKLFNDNVLSQITLKSNIYFTFQHNECVIDTI